MNIVWVVVILCGIFIAFLTGKIDIINEALLIDIQEAVVFAISLVGIMSIWLGLMNIARKSGLIDILAVSMRPITKFLFPSIPPNHPAISCTENKGGFRFGATCRYYYYFTFCNGCLYIVGVLVCKTLERGSSN